MLRNSMHKLNSFFLILAVWVSAIAFYPVSVAAQEKTDSDTDNKTEQVKKNNDPLSKKEDPEMIGKRNINGGTDKIWGWFGGSREKEMQIGRQVSAEIEQTVKLVEDPLVTEYINRVGQNIVLNSDAKIPFTIKVIDSDEVNAFALPGGYFYVNRGLILAADNEAELAGVMAHEIAHVAARHAMENAGKGTALNYGLIAGIIFTGGIAGAVLQNTAGIGQALAFFNFSRGAEKEADILGVQYLYASGYDPTAMATMFEKLASQNRKKKSTLSKLFSTHPQSIDRRDASLELVARFPEKEEYIISTSEFQKVKDYLLKQTNAKAAVIGDLDEGEPGRPTLKRRKPEPDGVEPGESSSDPESKGPPKLKRRGEPDKDDNDN